MRGLHWDSNAWEEYNNLTEENRTKVNKLIKNIQRNGYNCEGHVEMLKGNLKGKASVRINHKDRLVFRVTGDTVDIAQCGGHYNDK